MNWRVQYHSSPTWKPQIISHLNISLMQLLTGLNKCTSEFAKFFWQKLTLHNIAITKDHLPQFAEIHLGLQRRWRGVLVPEVRFQVKIQWIMLHNLAIIKDKLANFWEIYMRMWKRHLGMSLPEVRKSSWPTLFTWNPLQQSGAAGSKNETSDRGAWKRSYSRCTMTINHLKMDSNWCNK
jgi:hypothetical protein